MNQTDFFQTSKWDPWNSVPIGLSVYLLDTVKLTVNRTVSAYIATLPARPSAVDVVTQRNFHPSISGNHVNFCHLYSKAVDAKLLILIFHKIHFASL